MSTRTAERRSLLRGMACGSLLALSRRGWAAAPQRSSAEKTAAGQALRLRPHHILDIVTSHGAGERFEPHPYGHSLHIVAERVLSDLSLKTELVVAADAVCDGCRHLRDVRPSS